MKKIYGFIIIFILFHLSLHAQESEFTVKTISLEYLDFATHKSTKVKVELGKITELDLKTILKIADIRYKEYLATKNDKDVKEGPFVTGTQVFIYIEVGKKDLLFPFYELHDGKQLIETTTGIGPKIRDGVNKVFATVIERYRPK